jgi:hypothetical protein
VQQRITRKQPIIQVVPILTAVEVESSEQQLSTPSLQSFTIEGGRSEAIIQSDDELI